MGGVALVGGALLAVAAILQLTGALASDALVAFGTGVVVVAGVDGCFVAALPGFGIAVVIRALVVVVAVLGLGAQTGSLDARIILRAGIPVIALRTLRGDLVEATLRFVAGVEGTGIGVRAIGGLSTGALTLTAFLTRCAGVAIGTAQRVVDEMVTALVRVAGIDRARFPVVTINLLPDASAILALRLLRASITIIALGTVFRARAVGTAGVLVTRIVGAGIAVVAFRITSLLADIFHALVTRGAGIAVVAGSAVHREVVTRPILLTDIVGATLAVVAVHLLASALATETLVLLGAVVAVIAVCEIDRLVHALRFPARGAIGVVLEAVVALVVGAGVLVVTVLDFALLALYTFASVECAGIVVQIAGRSPGHRLVLALARLRQALVGGAGVLVVTGLVAEIHDIGCGRIDDLVGVLLFQAFVLNAGAERHNGDQTEEVLERMRVFTHDTSPSARLNELSDPVGSGQPKLLDTVPFNLLRPVPTRGDNLMPL